MGEYHSYIEHQAKLMADSPKLYTERGSAIAMQHPLADLGMFKIRVHNSELIPLPFPLRREIEFCGRVKSFCRFIYASPTIFAFVIALANMSQTQTFNWFQVLCISAGVVFIPIAFRATLKERGLFYLVWIWEQSLENRKVIFRAECRVFFDDMATNLATPK